MTETATETETETAIETGEFSSLFSVYSPNVTRENLEIHRHWHRVNFVIGNSDYSIHELRSIKNTNERAQQTSEFSDASQLVSKIVQTLSMV